MENIIWTDDLKFQPVTTIDQALWHLQLMKGSLQSAVNTPCPNRTEEDLMIDKAQAEALSVAIQYIRNHKEVEKTNTENEDKKRNGHLRRCDQ
jgi:hypothetical protein